MRRVLRVARGDRTTGVSKRLRDVLLSLSTVGADLIVHTVADMVDAGSMCRWLLPCAMNFSKAMTLSALLCRSIAAAPRSHRLVACHGRDCRADIPAARTICPNLGVVAFNDFRTEPM